MNASIQNRRKLFFSDPEISESPTSESTRLNKSIVRFLFPVVELGKIKGQLSPGFPTSSLSVDDRYFREKRVCHPSMFDRYFRMAIQDDDVFHSDIKRFLSALSSRYDFATTKEEFRSRGILENTIVRLRYWVDDRDAPLEDSMLSNLLVLAEEQPIAQYTAMGDSLSQIARSYIATALRARYGDRSDRARYLLSSFKRTKAMGTMAAILEEEQWARNNPSKHPGDFLVEEDDFKQMCKEWLEITIEASIAHPESLIVVPNLHHVLRLWDHLSPSTDAILKWANKIELNDVSVRRAILKAFSNPDGKFIATSEIEKYFGPGFRNMMYSRLTGTLEPEDSLLFDLYEENRRLEQEREEHNKSVNDSSTVDCSRDG